MQNPKNTEALCEKGQCLRSLNNIKDAILYIDKALIIKPSDNIALNAKALCLIKMNRYEDAIEYLDRGLQKSFINQLDYFERMSLLANKGFCLLRLKKYQLALDSTNEALRLYPRNPDCLIIKGKILMELERYGEAIESFEKVISIDSRNVEAWCERGYACFLLGSRDLKEHRIKDAMKCFIRVLETNPKNARAWIGKGCVLYVLDEDMEAKKCFENVIRFSDDKESIEIATEWLKKLE